MNALRLLCYGDKNRRNAFSPSRALLNELWYVWNISYVCCGLVPLSDMHKWRKSSAAQVDSAQQVLCIVKSITV